MPSTAIERISYDEAARELHVKFVGGGTYTYYDVPKPIHRAFVAAPSHGVYFNQFIKNRYDFRRHAA
jgi:hypothetical protein